VKADLRGFDGRDVRVAVAGGPFGPWQPYSPSFDLELGADQGPQDVRVQLRSFRNVRSIALTEGINVDTVPPRIDGPRVSLRNGKRVSRDGSRVPASAALLASDKTSGLRSSTLRASCGGEQRASAYREASSADLVVQLDRSGCTVRGIADDNVGHRRTKDLDPRVSLFDVRKQSDHFRLSGSWRTLRKSDSLGGSISLSGSRGAVARISFEGSQFAVVARRGPAGGRFEVILDGERIGSVDLYARTGEARRIVYVGNVPKGEHVLKLRATGAGAAASKGTLVWLDALLVLDRRQ
jgi:hypothetical protein